MTEAPIFPGRAGALSCCVVELPREFVEPVDGRFVIEHPVGEGAAGIVYRAFDLEKKRAVALKLMHAKRDEFLAPDQVDESALQLVREEAEVLAKVHHAGVIELIDCGWLKDVQRAYLAMQWVDGLELHKYHEVTPLSPNEIVVLGILVCRALKAVHQQGVIHQDIKPANIMMRRRPPAQDILPELVVEPVIIDFGTACKGVRLGVNGTPAYMSPEQAHGDGKVDSRTDLYSLGATLYELFVGRTPHQGASPLATLARLATTPAPRVSSYRADISSRVDDAIDRLLATDRDSRPATAQEAEELLLNCLDDGERESFPPNEASSQVDRGSTRLLTTVVAMELKEETLNQALTQVRELGAQAVKLGQSAIVAHLGVERATGSEAEAGLALGHRLISLGASVGLASGRARLESGHSGRVRPVGEVVDRAATLAREAAAGQMLSDATTSELGRGRFEFKVRGDGSAIVGASIDGKNAQRGGAPFIGRDAELAQILGAYERTENERHSMIVSVSGPPGIGKSRLQRECIARISSRAEAPRIIVQKNDAYARRHVLGAAADILRRLIELPQAASASEVQLAIVERLGPETMSELTQENQLVLTRLLSSEAFSDDAEPLAARDALWLAMTELVTRVLSNETIVLVTEDLQWADSESIAWIDHLLGRVSRHPLFVLSCVRPGFWEVRDERYKQRDHLRIDLHPISHHSVRMIAQSVLGEGAKEADLDRISTHAGGSPLFAEELARLTAGGKGAHGAPTIEAAIQASLDSLEGESREALGRLSVLGLSCWDTALPALGQKSSGDVLKKLVASEFLIEQSLSRFKNTTEYAFKHALVRDVAYETLAKETRCRLHAAAGQWLNQMGEDAATVASQLDLGGEHELSAHFWERAATRALAANALQDAVNMAERALDFAETPQERFRRASLLDGAHARLDPRAADRETAISAMESSAYDDASRTRALGAHARYDDARGMGVDVNQRLAKARDESERLGIIDEVARCSASLATRLAFLGEFTEAEKEVARLLELPVHRSFGTQVDAYQTLAIIRQAKGSVSASLDARKNAVSAAREARLKEREAMLTTNLGFALSTVGARKEAREALERGLFLAENIGSPGATRHAQMNLLGWAGLYGSDRGLDTHLSETRAEADAAATGYWAAPDRSNLGILFYRGVELLRSTSEGNRQRALALLKMSAESYRGTGNRDLLPVALGMWAEAERLCSNPEDAARIASEAAELLSEDAPSLLNESTVFLTLYRARLELGDAQGAHEALSSSIRPLLRRLNGLLGSPYAVTFLTQLRQNAELVAAAEAAGVLPESISVMLSNAS